ncbi:hypothetical protein TRICI_003614 [Trichomonascus ciferrii]|uniref:Uncharacterized protein n=1 Tax=Trichomonascus ciferrii TaxID=44093 RepID=A0A642V397_9ASCO|nr:hypothetical protein TRICI_003614 [Trichomonascus ciferrii]
MALQYFNDCYKTRVVLTGLIVWFVVTAVASVLGYMVVQSLRLRALQKLRSTMNSDPEKCHEKSIEDTEGWNLEEKFHWQRIYLTFFWVLVSGLIVFTVTGLKLEASNELSTIIYWSIFPLQALSFDPGTHPRITTTDNQTNIPECRFQASEANLSGIRSSGILIAKVLLQTP